MNLKPAVLASASQRDITPRPLAHAAYAGAPALAAGLAFIEITEDLHARLRSEEEALNARLLGRWCAFPRSAAAVRELAARTGALINARLPALRRSLDDAFADLSELDSQLDGSHRHGCLVHHRALVQPYFLQTPWTRRVVERAFGYAGDYLVVEALFDGDRGRLGDTPMAEMMSRYLMGTGPVRAHRDRLPWANARLTALADRLGRAPRVLSFACGPERVLRAWVADGHAGRLVLADFEPRALAHCRRKFTRLLGRAAPGTTVDYVETRADEVFRDSHGVATLADHTPDGRFDAVLVLGLLDYLEPRVILSLVDGLAELLADDGELLLTNLHAGNPWQSLMEYDGDWFVRHRTADEFRALATGAGGLIVTDELRPDATGTNLFFAGRRASSP
jgi:SAM-dependent methyltransferase